MMQIVPRQVDPSPISLARRVRRGFSRIGLALAVLVLSSGAFLTVYLAIEAADREARRHASLSCLKGAWAQGKAYARKYNPDIVDDDASGCPGSYPTWDELRAFNPKKPPSWTGSLFLYILQGIGMTAIATALAFAVPWTVGWILSGFLGE